MDLDTALTGKPAEGARATDILRADHREARHLFAEYRGAANDVHAAKVIAQTLCMKLELHDTIERDVLYPIAREVDAQWTANAAKAHDAIVTCVERVRAAADTGERLEDAIGQLQARVEEHVADEEKQLFPKLEAERASSLADIGRALIKRKEELTRSTESFEGPAT
jgi:hemerythrin superfamily protein